MKLSVHIPTFRRPAIIDRCLVALSEQACDASFEIIVGLDGSGDLTPEPTVPHSIRDKTRVVRFPKIGYIGVRRAMLEQTQAEIVLWLNDDSYAHPGLLDAHLALHNASTPRVVGGGSVWKPILEPDLFDELVQTTDLVFFQQQKQSTPFGTDYRNCYGLNMSFPRELANSAGSIPDIPDCYGYDDIELAYRLARAGAEIWHAPSAIVTHDHRYRAIDVHRREYQLGRAAWHFAAKSPEFAHDLFTRDIRSPDEIAYTIEVLQRERRDAERIERSFLSHADTTAGAADGTTLRLIAEHWVLLKRYLWRWGLHDAAHDIDARWSLLRDFGVCPSDAVAAAH